MKQNIVAKPILNRLVVKKVFLLCYTSALVACGSNDNSTKNSTINQPPTEVAFNTVTALNQTTIETTWSLAKDDRNIASTLRYQVHLSESANFSPSSTTLKFEQRGATATQLTNLAASTTYFLKLVVIDEDNAQTVSTEKSVTTSAIDVINQAPSNVVLSNVKANAATIEVAWPAASDDLTPANDLLYEVHLAEGGDFTPSPNTLKFSGKNILGTKITNLKVAKNYSIKLVVIDEQGRRTLSAVKYINILNQVIVATGLLNDTGITWCVNDNIVFGNCNVGSLGGWFGLNQDGEVGRDSMSLEKIGGGEAGFDFTKINALGQPVLANASEWQCVKDNHTGLMWEVKTDDGGLRDKDNTYQWYNTDSSSNGGTVGYQNDGNSTQAFVQSVNAQRLCGFSDWRMPNKQELHTIVHYGKQQLAIDSKYFPNTKNHYYWSSPVASHKNYAWMVNFSNGHDRYSDKSSSHYVRLVRSDK